MAHSVMLDKTNVQNFLAISVKMHCKPCTLSKLSAMVDKIFVADVLLDLPAPKDRHSQFLSWWHIILDKMW